MGVACCHWQEFEKAHISVKEYPLGEVTNDKAIQSIYQQILEVLVQACSRALQAVNTEMVACYWQIGRLVGRVERIEYGKRLIMELSKRLAELSGGFSKIRYRFQQLATNWTPDVLTCCYEKINCR